MEKTDNKDDVFFHIINFANNPELWEKRREIINKDIAIDFKKKEFIEKHLSENFKNLINDEKLIISLGNFIGYAPFPFLSPNFPNFILAFGFTERDIFSKNQFQFEVKLKDITTNRKVVNKKELRLIFNELLFRVGYEIGYTQGMVERIDLDIIILRNEKENLIIQENIINNLPDKTQYEATLQRVRKDVSKNKELHKLEKYIKKRFSLKNDTDYINFLRKELGQKNITYSALEKSLDRFRKTK